MKNYSIFNTYMNSSTDISATAVELEMYEVSNKNAFNKEKKHERNNAIHLWITCCDCQ